MLVQVLDKNVIRGRGPARATYGIFVSMQSGDKYVPGDGFVDGLGQKVDLKKLIPGITVQTYAEMMDASKIVNASIFGPAFNALFPGPTTCVILIAGTTTGNGELTIGAYGISSGNLVEAGPVTLDANAFPIFIIVHATMN